MQDINIKIPSPSWDSNLTNLIIDLEKLREKRLFSYNSIPPYIFFQLKNVFQILETLGSARIEGNNTTLSEYIENRIEKNAVNEQDREISNIEGAISFIEENIEHFPINRMFITQLHKIITKDLTHPPNGEGSLYPGELRKHNIKIHKAKHIPPDFTNLNDYFEEFVKFINQDLKEQHKLLMIAIAHHRFLYIHPFDNANGRVGRVLNYALLIKLGFKVNHGKILNPSSVFYNDRDKYYDMLSLADSIRDNDILAWCEYFLKGLKNEIEKIDTLLDKSFVKAKILLPTLSYVYSTNAINQKELSALKLIINSREFSIKSQELSKIGIDKSIEKSRLINKLKEKNIIKPIKKGGRIYTINFINNYLLRGVVKYLEKEGFVSDFLEGNG